MRTASLLSIAVFAALLVEAYLNGPERLVMKYDFSGNPISWASRGGYVLFFTCFFGFYNVVLLGLRALSARGKLITYFNTPNRDHWQRPERRPELILRMGRFFDAMLVFINVMSCALLEMARFGWMGARVNVVVGAILAGSLGIVVYAFRLFRI